MYVQSNMFIIMIKIAFPIALIWMFLTPCNMMAQENNVCPLTQTVPNPLQAEIFLYVSWGTSKNGNLWTATNNVNNKDIDVYGTYFDAGLEAELFKQKLNTIRLGASLGYKYEVYAYNKSLFNNSGVYSHWLSADLDFNFCYLNVGVKSDIFLTSKIKNNDHFSYEGLYNDCFNRMSLCYYVGLNIRSTCLKFEARMGLYLEPQFSPEKISYHNMNKTHVDGLYLEIRAFYRIFTTGKVHSAPYMFDE